jgi:hypothetical protein
MLPPRPTRHRKSTDDVEPGLGVRADQVEVIMVRVVIALLISVAGLSSIVRSVDSTFNS